MPSRTQLVSAGKSVAEIPVELSYQIINHFSAGLYTSPNKALEELVANSYDAWAQHVHVVLPKNLSAPGATIWVVDDGEGMGLDGFRQLWRIGDTNKRDPGYDARGRPQIGKFGIGKLATYVLAKELTHVCRRGREFLAVSMDFSRLEQDPGRRSLRLKVRKLTAAQARKAVQPILKWHEDGTVPFSLFGRGAANTWTVAAMASLKQLAMGLKPGQLKRVLCASLPINPQFNLYFGGEKLQPQKIRQTAIREWVIGADDKTAKALSFGTARLPDGRPAVIIPHLGEIWGEVELYQDPLPGGKSDIWGRSDGYFIMVRGRLINLHSPLFGLEVLSHGAFSRFRMVVHADGLDDFLRATRESVSETEEAVVNLREYLRAKFNEARSEYETWAASRAAEKSLPHRISATPRSLSRQPLINAIRRVLDGDLPGMWLTRVPDGLGAEGRAALIANLERGMESDEFVGDLRFEPLGMEAGLAVFDAAQRSFHVNMLHPFFANYAHLFRSPEPFQLLAVTEVLTEAYLLEEGMAYEQVERIMNRRDRFLRELVFSTRLAAPLVAQLLDENRAHAKGLEKALSAGMACLGFEVSPMGASGEPDGLALARMGVRDEATGASETYKVSYEAKSTGKPRVSAKDINAAAVAQHRDDTGAQFAVVVAPGFDGDGARGSNAVKQAKKHNITLVALDDFIRLILAAATRPLGYRRLRDGFFSKCRGPLDAKRWVDRLLREKATETPLREILEAIWEMMTDSPDPPKFAAVRERLAARAPKFASTREKEIREWVESVRRFERDLVTVEGDRVYLDNPPDAILERVSGHATKLPAAILTGSMYATLLPKKERPVAPKAGGGRGKRRKSGR